METCSMFVCVITYVKAWKAVGRPIRASPFTLMT